MERISHSIEMTTAPRSCQTNGKLSELRTMGTTGETNRWKPDTYAISKRLLNFGRRRGKRYRLLVCAGRDYKQVEDSEHDNRTSENKSHDDTHDEFGRNGFAISGSK